MKFLTGTLARILYAIPFIIFGINHFIYADQMVNVIPSYFPVKMFFVYFTGAALIAAGVSIITKIKIRLASLLLALMLGIFVLTVHLPGVFKEASRQMAMISLLKDTSLAAAALIIAGISGNK